MASCALAPKATIFCDWDPEGALEHDALAMAAGVSPQELYTTTNMTDIRDILLVQLRDAGQPPVAERRRLHHGAGRWPTQRRWCPLASQTWDLNPQDVDDVWLSTVAPAMAPPPGRSPAMVVQPHGINEQGLSVGTTNIKTDDSRIGVGYLSILHRAIRRCRRSECGGDIRAPSRRPHLLAGGCRWR